MKIVASIFVLALSLLNIKPLSAQAPAQPKVSTSDIDNFWTAYDSINSTADRYRQLNFINTLYFEKGTEGLRAFVKSGNYSAERYVRVINDYPLFWKSVRRNTLAVKEQVPAIEKNLEKLRLLYPDLKPAGIYFTVGALRSGGMTVGNMVLIGTEIASADTGTNALELTNWLRSQFAAQVSGNIVALNIHEFIHTQQKNGAATVLGQCLVEGAADFVAEIVTKQKNLNEYMIFGQQNEAALKQKFKNEMWRRNASGWIYNTGQVEHPELGYFMGFVICRAYYQNAKDKAKAIKEIIELDFSDRNALSDFLEKSRYYPNSNLRLQ
ncbi:MAG: hypothetical protein ABW036_03565 [Flavitalea sp.]